MENEITDLLQRVVEYLRNQPDEISWQHAQDIQAVLDKTEENKAIDYHTL